MQRACLSAGCGEIVQGSFCPQLPSPPPQSWRGVRSSVTWVHLHSSSASISRVSSGFVPRHFLTHVNISLDKNCVHFCPWESFLQEPRLSCSIPVNLSGFPKSDPNSHQFLCRHTFFPQDFILNVYLTSQLINTSIFWSICALPLHLRIKIAVHKYCIFPMKNR